MNVDMLLYADRRFRSVDNSANGEVSGETVFHYREENGVVWATYTGGDIRFGTLTGLKNPDGSLDFTYQHVNRANELRTGRCHSTPTVLKDGRLRLHERWTWTSGDASSGESTIEELPSSLPVTR